jgi:hypothetical protein
MGEFCNHVLCSIQQVYVGARVKEPQFIRALMTAICLSSIESKCSCNISFFQIQHNLESRAPSEISVINYINCYHPYQHF